MKAEYLHRLLSNQASQDNTKAIQQLIVEEVDINFEIDYHRNGKIKKLTPFNSRNQE